MKLYGRVNGEETAIAGGGETQVQSDWRQADTTAVDFIKNKPDLTEHLPIIPKTKTETDVVVGFDDVGTVVDVTWTGLTNFSGYYVWTDGTDIYYSYASTQYVLDKSTSTWTAKTWAGLTSFYGNDIWTDGTDIYYSYESTQYVLDKSTSTWTAKTWNGLTSFEGLQVWTDGTDIYHSVESTQYVLDKSTSTWTAKTWTGLTSFYGSFVWTDGTDIYYSYASTQYVLDKSTSTWTTKTWTGLTRVSGHDIWTDGTDIYYSYESTQYILDKSTSTWTTKTWNGLSSFSAAYIWTDGTDIYYSDGNIHKKIINRRHINNNFEVGAASISQSSTLTLTVNGWNSSTLQQTVTFAHDTTKRNVIDITVSEVEDWADYGVLPVSETASGITFKCEEIPDSALTFTVCSMSTN